MKNNQQKRKQYWRPNFWKKILFFFVLRVTFGFVYWYDELFECSLKCLTASVTVVAIWKHLIFHSQFIDLNNNNKTPLKNEMLNMTTVSRFGLSLINTFNYSVCSVFNCSVEWILVFKAVGWSGQNSIENKKFTEIHPMNISFPNLQKEDINDDISCHVRLVLYLTLFNWAVYSTLNSLLFFSLLFRRHFVRTKQYSCFPFLILVCLEACNILVRFCLLWSWSKCSSKSHPKQSSECFVVFLIFLVRFPSFITVSMQPLWMLCQTKPNKIKKTILCVCVNLHFSMMDSVRIFFSQYLNKFHFDSHTTHTQTPIYRFNLYRR